MKGQATQFIILGILIVALVLGFIAVRKTETGERISAVTVPEQARPVKELVDSCINLIAEEGVNLLGSRGGYINVPADIGPRSIVNPFSNNLEIFQDKDIVVPYWYYLKSNNVERTQVPRLVDMEKGLSEYIDNNLDRCLFNLDELRNRGYEINLGISKTEVKIGNENIIVKTKLTTEILLKDFKFDFDDYVNTLEIPLGKLYFQAQKILEAENKNTFLENKTIDYMVVYDEIPYSGIDFSCTPETWVKSKVYADFKSILEANIPLIKIKNTRYEETDESKYYEIETELNNKDLQANFQYSREWPFFMDIVSHPKEEMLRGEPYTTENAIARYLAPLFCLNSYNFVYDVKYPVLISLAEEDYVFQYALLVVIDNNYPRQNKLEIDQSYDTSSVICENPGKEIKIYALAAREDNSLTPLRDTKISYECVSSVCYIGATNEDASLVAKFPQCLNGMLIAEKEGYHAVREELSTNQEQAVTIVLEPYYELKPEIYIIEGSSLRNISKNEQVVFVLEEVEKEHTVAITQESESVKLVAGDYHAVSYIIQESSSEFKIQGKEIETCVERPRKSILGFLGATTKECKTVKLDNYALEQAVTGGVEFDFNLDRDELAKGKVIRLYTVREGVPTNIDELTNIHDKIKQNVNNKNFRLPEVR